MKFRGDGRLATAQGAGTLRFTLRGRLLGGSVVPNRDCKLWMSQRGIVRDFPICSFSVRCVDNFSAQYAQYESRTVQ